MKQRDIQCIRGERDGEGDGEGEGEEKLLQLSKPDNTIHTLAYTLFANAN